MRRWLTLLVLLALVGTVGAGCSTLPESGSVHRAATSRAEPADDLPPFAPPGPTAGATPTAVVKGFLLAMTAVPVSTSVARTFLSSAARADWSPNQTTVVYQSQSFDVTAGGVRVRLGDSRRLDSRGGWLGRDRSAGDLDLQLVRDHDQWRIANPPDALLVPQWYLASLYDPYNLYFFDQTERVLVPDRIYVPRGEQSASTLVRALLAGPGSDLAPVTRSAFPPQAQLDLSVQVSPTGVAEVPLSKEIRSLPPSRMTRLEAQLAWTLRQVRGVYRVRLTAGQAPVFLPDGRSDFGVQEGEAFAPSGVDASDRIFGLRKGRVVSADGASIGPVTGPLGRSGFALRSVAATLNGRRFIAVAADGRTVFGSEPGKPVRQVYTGADVLRPAYDMFGTAWLVDRTPGGARVVDTAGRRQRVLGIAGVSGRDVRAFLVSRDGTRFVAVIRGPNGLDTVLTALVERSADGTVSRVLAARKVDSVPKDVGRIVDIAWTSPNDLAVLGRSQGVSQVALVSLDGSPGDARQVQPDLYRGRAKALVGSPDSSLPLFLVAPSGALLTLSPEGHWGASNVAKDVSAATYAG